MKTVARFEKVSLEQWKKGYDSVEWKQEADYKTIVLPKRATRGSAGYDFFAPFDFVIKPHSSIKIPTGIKSFIENGFVLEVYPRSSLGFKHRVMLCNTVGIIDSDYYNNSSNEGHIFIKLYNQSDKAVEISEGESFAQGIFKEFCLAEEDEVTENRVGGIGSTN